MKKILLLLVFSFGLFPCLAAQEAAKTVSPSELKAAYKLEILSGYYRAFARKYGFEDGIISKAADSRVPVDEFPAFYRARVRERMDNIYASYNAALKEVLNNPQAAYSKYSAEMVKNPAEYSAQFFHALAAQSLHDTREAMDGYTAVLSLQPQLYDGIVYYWRGSLSASLLADEEAVADFTDALKIMPGLPQALLGRSFSYNRLGYYQMAAADLNAYFANEEPMSGLKLQAQQSDVCEVLRYRGYAIPACADLHADGDYIAMTSSPTLTVSITDAWAQVTALLRAGSESPADVAPVCKTVAMNELAGGDQPVRRLKTALYLLDKSLSLQENAHSYYIRAQVKYRLAVLRYGYYLDALPDFTKAAVLDDRFSRAWDWLMVAYIFEKYGDVTHSLGALDSAVASDPANHYLYQQRARFKLLAGDLRGARDDMREFFKVSKDVTFNARVASGKECKTLALEGYSVNGCQEKVYFAAGGAVTDIVPPMPPMRLQVSAPPKPLATGTATPVK